MWLQSTYVTDMINKLVNMPLNKDIFETLVITILNTYILWKQTKSTEILTSAKNLLEMNSFYYWSHCFLHEPENWQYP